MKRGAQTCIAFLGAREQIEVHRGKIETCLPLKPIMEN
jgi:hypothetical protein